MRQRSYSLAESLLATSAANKWAATFNNGTFTTSTANDPINALGGALNGALNGGVNRVGNASAFNDDSLNFIDPFLGGSGNGGFQDLNNNSQTPSISIDLDPSSNDFLSASNSFYPQQQQQQQQQPQQIFNPMSHSQMSPYYQMDSSISNKPLNPEINRRYSMHDHAVAMRRIERKHSTASESFLSHHPNSHSYSSLPAYPHSPFAAHSPMAMEYAAPSSPFSHTFSTTPLDMSPSRNIYNSSASITTIPEHSAYISPNLLEGPGGADSSAANAPALLNNFPMQVQEPVMTTAAASTSSSSSTIVPSTTEPMDMLGLGPSTAAPISKKRRTPTRKAASKRVYTCNIDSCGLQFNRLASLQDHALTHSADYALAKVKPFTCPTCDQTFSRSHDLKRHMYMHDQRKPYICARCDRGFSRRDALNRHEKSVKEGKKVNCVPVAEQGDGAEYGEDDE